MIMNNLDDAVAQFPDEIVTYGGNGSVFNNWAQYHLTMKYLSEMTEEQTLTMYSGHPQALAPSRHHPIPHIPPQTDPASGFRACFRHTATRLVWW